MAKLVSKVYGDALFQVAVEENRVDEIMDEISTVKKVLLENPEFVTLMEHPEIVKEEKIQLIEESFKGRVSDDVTGFLTIVTRKGRFHELPAIFEYLSACAKEYKSIGIVQVTSATPLANSWKEKVREKLLATTGYQALEISFEVDESLMGGLVIRMGDRVVDSSLKYKLELLKNQLLKISLDDKKEGERAL